jgi:hypothetical protein
VPTKKSAQNTVKNMNNVLQHFRVIGTGINS